MQPIVIKQTMEVLQEAPTVIASGRTANGDTVCFSTLGPGVEVQIATPGSQVKHKCFHNVYAFLFWYCETYIETGRL